MNIAVLFISMIMLLFISIILWIWLLMVPGKTWWSLISTKLPWNRGKANLIHLHTTTGKIKHIFRRIIPENKLLKVSKSHNKINEQHIYLPELYHQMDENGTPIYIVHEEIPISIIIKQLNLEHEMKQLDDALLISEQILKSKNQEIKKEYLLSINRLLPQLAQKLSLVEEAKKIVLDTIYLSKDKAKVYIKGKEEYFADINIDLKLEYYIDHLIRIRERIYLKNKTFVNTKDLFGAISGQKYMKQVVTLAGIDGFLEAMMSIKKDNIWNYILAGLIVMGIIAAGIGVATTSKLKEQVGFLDAKINGLNSDINSLKNYIIPMDENGIIINPGNTPKVPLQPNNVQESGGQ